MACISEVTEKIYEIQPEGNELDRFPLCTVYFVVDEKTALVETGCPAQVPDILKAIEGLGYDVRKLSYIIPTHVHIDHGGAAGHLAQLIPNARVVCPPKAGRLYSDPIILDKLMQGFMRTFGKDAKQRFGLKKTPANARISPKKHTRPEKQRRQSCTDWWTFSQRIRPEPGQICWHGLTLYPRWLKVTGSISIHENKMRFVSMSLHSSSSVLSICNNKTSEPGSFEKPNTSGTTECYDRSSPKYRSKSPSPCF